MADFRRARASRRRKRRMDLAENDLDREQWLAIQAAWGGCAYCGAAGMAYQKDCVLALSRGGRYTLDNIVPACRSCNASKCNEEVTAWLRRKRMDESGFLLRYSQIRKALASEVVLEAELDAARILGGIDSADGGGANAGVGVGEVCLVEGVEGLKAEL